MKQFLSVLSFAFVFSISAAAQSSSAAPEFELEKAELEAHLRFLASDELQGRRTGSPGNDMAARYIAAQFDALGLATAPGAEGYFQPIAFEATAPPATARLVLNKTEYLQGDNMLILLGNADGLKTDAVFANHGWADAEAGYDDYEGLDVRGKIVFVLPGTPEKGDMMSVFNSIRKKQEIAREKGAAALIELYRLQFPWGFFLSFFNKENLALANPDAMAEPIIYGWLKEDKDDGNMPRLQEGKKLKAELSSQGFYRKPMPSQNVIGIIPGSDPELRDEYLLLSAHYDHVGVGKEGGMPYTPEDSIFNGSRDNALGTTALLAAAKALSKQPPRRSVIVMAFTGEELGLLGSRYYADNPLIPLEKTIFNLNTDGAGYNDVTYISVFGHGRTGVDALIEAGANVFGLDVFPNPAPEQGLYDRSDNVSFAQKGVPAVNISPGMTEFDEAILQYYHQAADNPDTIDFDYLHKYAKAYARIARLIADWDQRPWWAEGDKYEKAGQELYGK